MASEVIVRFRGQPFISSITLAGGGQAYTTGQVICGAAATIHNFGTTLASLNSGRGTLVEGSVLSSDAQSTGRSIQLNGLRAVINATALGAFTGELVFYCKAMTVTNAAAHAPTNSDLINYYVGKVNFNASDWDIRGANLILDLDNLDKVFVFPDPADFSIITGQLWAVLITKQSVSVAGGEVININCEISKD